MIQLSLWLNIGVLVPVSFALAMNRPGVQQVFGEHSPARGILQSVYFSILVASIALLLLGDPRSSAVLLGVQIVYKITTPFSVRTFRNPVVLSNLGIAAFHIGSLLVSRSALSS
ncbi:MAG: hypothetical protein KBF88_01515 [Polyangiaceae bacterium]|nr:hypothetical protein [Polyangiaceae bacterium]